MIQPLFRGSAALCLAGLTVACAPPAGRVVLLPQPGGPSAVVVTTATGNTRLKTPYAAAEVGREGGIKAVTSSAAEVGERYPALLQLRPPAPRRFILNFQPGTSSLTPASAAELDTVMSAARARSGGEIVIVGHTDRQGAAEDNDALSLRRANAVRDLLLRNGFQGDLVTPIGRGEREPLVATEDDVAEPRNRRAEIIVR